MPRYLTLPCHALSLPLPLSLARALLTFALFDLRRRQHVKLVIPGRRFVKGGKLTKISGSNVQVRDWECRMLVAPD